MRHTNRYKTIDHYFRILKTFQVRNIDPSSLFIPLKQLNAKKTKKANTQTTRIHS